jgi:DNA-directed RNA polymerase specialized sigma subunit
MPVPCAPARRVLQNLAGLDDGELLGMIRALPGGSESRVAACELLVSRHRHLVWSCVQSYRRSPEPAEDLMQVGYVGLMKAISRFDPAIGGSLAAYAQPTITGEIKGTSGTSAGRSRSTAPSRNWCWKPARLPGS